MALLAMSAAVAGGATVFSSAGPGFDEFEAAVAAAELHPVGVQTIPSPGDFLQTTIPATALVPGGPAGPLFPTGTDQAIGLILRTNSSLEPTGFQTGGNLMVTGALASGEPAFVGPSISGDGVDVLAAPPDSAGLVRALGFRIRPDGDLRVRLSAYAADGSLLVSELLPAGTTRAAVLVVDQDLLRVHLRVDGGYVEISEISVFSSAGPVDAAMSTLAADPSSGLVANGSDEALLTIALRDSLGRLRAGGGGTVVFLSTTLGDLDPVFPAGDGTLSSRLVSSRSGTATITARLASEEILGTAQVVFDPDPDAPPPVLVISVNDAVKWEGDPDPEFQVGYSGFPAGDNESMLEGALVFTREPGEVPGSYRVTPSGVSSSLYDIRFDTGTLVIEPAGAARIHANAGEFSRDVAGRNFHFIGTQPIPSAGTGAQAQLPGASVFPGQAAGSLFPQGTLEELGITIQTNTLGGSPSTPSPGGLLLATGPATAGANPLLGPANTAHSLDLVINPPGFQGLVRAIDFPVSTLDAAVTVRVFDSGNSLSDAKILAPGTAHVGIVMPEGTFVRVNIQADGGVDIGDISLHASAGPPDVESSSFEASPLEGLVANGTDAALLRATVRDAEGRLRDGPGDVILFQTDLGSIGPVVLSEDGSREAHLVSTSAGTASVVARLGGEPDSPVLGTASVEFDPDPGAVPQTLTVTALDAFKWTGDPDPEFRVAFSGFRPGDDASVLQGTPVFTREPGESAGDFRITPSGVSSSDYSLEFIPGTLTIRDPLAAYFDADPVLFDARIASGDLYFIGRQSFPSPGAGLLEALPSAIHPGQGAGSLLPSGTDPAMGLTIQTNSLAGNPASPAPGAGLSLSGPTDPDQPALVGPSDANQSLDLIIAPPGFRNLVRALAFTVQSGEGASLEIRLYDGGNTLLDTHVFPPGTKRVGILMDRDDLVRINLHAPGGFPEIGEIDLFSSAGPLDAHASSLEATPSSNLLADGNDAALLTVTARDGQGRLRAGAGDEFFVASTLGVATTLVDQGDGTYTASLTSGVTGNATVDVRIDHPATGSLVGTAVVSFDRLPAAASISQPVAVEETIPFFGRTTIDASVLSSTGSAVPGTTVSITTEPAGVLEHPASIVSDANGLVAFDIVSSGLGSGNVTLSLSIEGASASLALEVLPKTLRVIAEDKTKAPGDPDPTFTVRYEGFVPGDDESVLQGTLAVARQPGEALGTYSVTPSGLFSDSYGLEFVSGNLVIALPPFASVFASDSSENPVFDAVITERGYYLPGSERLPTPGVAQDAILPVASIFPGQAAGPLLPSGTDSGLGITIRTNSATDGTQEFVAGGPLAISGPPVEGGPALIGPANAGDALDLLLDPPGLREEIRAVSWTLSADAGVFVTLLDGNNTVLDAVELPPGTRSVGLVAGEAGLRRVHLAAAQGLFAVGEIGIHLARGPLVARDDELFLPGGTGAKYHASQLLDNDIELEGATLSVASVSSASTLGGAATLEGSWIFYTPPGGGLLSEQEDSFTAVISNGSIQAATVVRVIPVPAPARIAGNLVKITPLPGGGVRGLFAGIPGLSYLVEASSDLVSWQPLGSVVADPQGRLVIEDSAAGASRFYRFSGN